MAKATTRYEVIITAGSQRATADLARLEDAELAARKYAKGNAIDGAELRIETYTHGKPEAARMTVSHYRCHRGAWLQIDGAVITGLPHQASLF